MQVDEREAARQPHEEPFALDFSPAHGAGSHVASYNWTRLRKAGEERGRRERRERHLVEICDCFFSEEEPHESGCCSHGFNCSAK